MGRLQARPSKPNSMKIINYIWILVCLITFNSEAQQKKAKTSQTIKTSKDVVIDLNTSYVEIEVDTWNKGSVEIEAYVQGEQLSDDELERALKNWKLDIDGAFDRVIISSKGAHGSWDVAGDFDLDLHIDTDVLKEMELQLANLPDIPEIPDMPDMPDMPEMELPEMPELPELPELPEGINNVQFDTEAYRKGGEKYLEEWSKEYEKKYGKKYKEKMKAWARNMDKIDFSDYEKKMEAWGERFGKKFGEDYAKKMEAWGEELGKRFDGDWQAKMEAWGERYGQRMEQHAKRLEERLAAQEGRREQMAERAQLTSDRARALADRARLMADRKAHMNSKDSRIKKVIKIKMPKDAKVQMNVRHGELKFSSVIHNLKASISHASLLANHIDGGNTSIDVSYSPVYVDLWSMGELNLNYVKTADLKSVGSLVLGSNSSDVEIGTLSGNAIIEGSFGDLIINDIADSFNNLSIILESSDALIQLPNVSHHFQFKGNQSKLSHPNKNSGKSSTSFSNGSLSSNKNIVVSAKYSDVTMQ